MGLLRAAIGAIGGALADQWTDFLTVPKNIAPTAALFPAVRMGTNAGRGSNFSGSDAIVTNGSKIIVPEGYGLLLMQDGEITGFASEPGGYIWNSDDKESESIFAGNSLSSSLLSQSWGRFKFGGRPSSQQLALFVCMKELPNNKFGTQSEIYWDDAYLNSQVGAKTRGIYSLKIVDPIKFAKQFVPSTYLQGMACFDFTDHSNATAGQIFSEVVSSLAAAFSRYTNDPNKLNRISNIQQDSVGFAASLAHVVDEAYSWRSSRGMEIDKVAIVGIEYDEGTKDLLRVVQRADALKGARGNANLQASVAAGIAAAGDSEGAGGIIGLGIAGGALGLSGFMQGDSSLAEGGASETNNDLLRRLENLKRAMDSGLIDETEFAAAKAKALGL